MKKGLIYIFTGEGKGKTSAAIGTAVRSALLGKAVCWVAFYKQESWGIAEKKLPEKLPKIEMYFMGRGFRIGKKTAPVGTKGQVVVDTASEEEHKQAAGEALELAGEKLASGQYFLVVIDEVLNAVAEGIIAEQDVWKLLKRRGATHVVLTGRDAGAGIIERADLVTECRKIKHPYDRGEMAVQGLDF